MYSRFSTNSDSNASELLETLEDMFPRYYMQSDRCSMIIDTIMCYPSLENELEENI